MAARAINVKIEFRTWISKTPQWIFMKFGMCVLIGTGSICIVFGGWGTSIFEDRGGPKNGNFSTSLLFRIEPSYFNQVKN